MDVDGLCDVFERMRVGEIRCLVCDMVVPLLWVHAILNSMSYTFLDDVLFEECRACVVYIWCIEGEFGVVDVVVICAVVEEVESDPCDLDELYDLLCIMIVLWLWVLW